MDITFDLSVALFFAAYQYIEKENGKSTYKLNINDEAAVYCFMFGHDILREDEYLETNLFSHAFPERPKRQKCTGYAVGYEERNNAAQHIIYRLKFKKDFNTSGLPRAEELFPSRNEDKFYDLLLRYKEKNKNKYDFVDSIIEYEF